MCGMSSPEAMSPPIRSFDPDALLANAGWVRALARSLVPSDAHLADDVAQDACLAALEHPPGTDRPIRAWLTSVVKNLVLQNRRGSARRSAREERSAQSEAQPSTLDHVEALSVHRALVEAVMDLDEPYRETIVQRFFEELSPSAIAHRQRVPVATVKTRLARGLDKLRARLDHDHGGDGRSWLPALIPLTRTTGGATATTLGALFVSTNIKIAIAATAIACGLVALWPSHKAAEPALASAPKIEALAAAPGVDQEAKGAPWIADVPREERQAARAPIESKKPESPAVAAPIERLHGRVLDATVRPQAGLRVYFSAGRKEISAREFNVPKPKIPEDAPAATTDASGGFEIPLPKAQGELAVSDDRWTTVLSSLCGPVSSTSEHVIVVAPHLEHSGRVIDAAGRPLAQARIEIQVPRDLRIAFPHILDSSTERGWVAESDAQGRFELSDAPRIDSAKLQVALDGYVPVSQPAPDVSDHALEIVLRRPERRPGMVAGQVVDERGRLVPGARVTLGRQALVISDDNGAFAIEIPTQGAKTPWIAVKEGHQPAIQDASAVVQSGRADEGEFVRLQLGPAPLSISGRVVDDEDRPQGGFKVFVADPTFFGAFDEVPTHVEGMLVGAAVRADLEKLMANAPEGRQPEDLLKDTSSVFWTFVRTDAGGRFKIEGLLDRAYRVAALDPSTLLRVETEPISAGRSNVSIRLPKNPYLENVRGRVMTNGGQPVAGVTLSPNHDVMTVQIDEHSRSTFGINSQPVVTDAEGRFSFARLPREKVYLKITSDGILPLDWGRKDAGGIEAAAHGKLDEIVIHVALRHHFQVEIAPETADEVRVVDTDGHEVPIHVFEGNSSMRVDTIKLVGGRSKVLVVGEEARTLVLLKEKKEVRRVPLVLVQGEMNVVRP
jgi:RNA polymerase sigma-70 factor (ECF subfamily)